jgi:LacI family transcriptional regulator
LLRSLNVDNFDIGRQAVQHLAGLGHRSIGFVGGDERISNQHDRWEGFLSASDELGLVPREQQIIKGLGWQLDDRERSALARLLAAPQRPTAIFAAGYELALDVYAAAEAAGLRVPHDLSVVGVDDAPSAPYISPPLTTLREPLVLLGNTALVALFDQIHGMNAHAHKPPLSAELILRSSTRQLVA